LSVVISEDDCVTGEDVSAVVISPSVSVNACDVVAKRVAMSEEVVTSVGILDTRVVVVTS